MQIISGKGNPLARAAARGEAGHERAMQQAVAYDLDTLQRLAVTETTLSGALPARNTLGSIRSKGPVPYLPICPSSALYYVSLHAMGVRRWRHLPPPSNSDEYVQWISDRKG